MTDATTELATTVPAGDAPVEGEVIQVAAKRARYRPQAIERTVESPDDLMDVEWVLMKTGWSIDTLNRRIAAGKYPKPCVGGGKRADRKWARKQHTRWVDKQIEKSVKDA